MNYLAGIFFFKQILSEMLFIERDENLSMNNYSYFSTKKQPGVTISSRTDGREQTQTFFCIIPSG